MAADVVIGVDVGTTATKVVAYRYDGTAVADATRDYPLHTPHPAWAEQDPDQVVDAALDALAEVAAAADSTVTAIGLSTVMHSLIGLDGDGRPLTPMVTYADSRAWPQALRLRRDHGLDLYHATGTPIHPMAPLAKLTWFGEEQPDLTRRVRRWVSIKEYLLARLCDSDVVDHSVASATGLWNLHTLDWHRHALDAAGVDADQLGRPVPTTTLLDHLLPSAAEQLGLPTDTRVVVGASDGVLANLGVGAVEPGVAALTIGTSGAIRVTAHEPRTDPDMRTFCYALTEQHWVLGGAISNGGLVPQWINGLLGGGDDYADLTAAAADVPAGSDGVLMLPYLTAERAPQWSPLRGGVLFGLGVDHGRGHIARAALEGVALQLRLVADALRETTDRDFDTVRVTGGFVSSDLWLQIVADVLGTDLQVPETAEGAAWGAAMLALQAVGQIDDLAETAADKVQIARTIVHDAQAAERYEAVAERYADLIAAVEPLLRDMTADERRP
ncbi:gluconokinase [soil metagenome]